MPLTAPNGKMPVRATCCWESCIAEHQHHLRVPTVDQPVLRGTVQATRLGSPPPSPPRRDHLLFSHRSED